MTDTGQPRYEPEDCVAEHLGDVTLPDGRVVQGLVLTFPVAPPRLPIGVVWDRRPLRLSIKVEQ